MRLRHRPQSLQHKQARPIRPFRLDLRDNRKEAVEAPLLIQDGCAFRTRRKPPRGLAKALLIVFQIKFGQHIQIDKRGALPRRHLPGVGIVRICRGDKLCRQCRRPDESRHCSQSSGTRESAATFLEAVLGACIEELKPVSENRTPQILRRCDHAAFSFFLAVPVDQPAYNIGGELMDDQ